MTHEEDVEENEPVKPFGDRLSEARESLGLSLDELSESLNLDLAILRALESSDVNSLPPAIYVQGYIKAYTKALGISSDAIHVEYLKTVNRDPTIELRPRSPLPTETNSGTPIVKTISVIFGLLALAAVIFGIYSYYAEKVDSIEVVQENEGTSLSLPLKATTVILDEGETEVGEQRPAAEPVAAETEVTESPQEVVTKREVEKAAPVVVQQTPVSDQTVVGLDRLTLRAIAPSWADIRDAEKTRLYFDMLKEGDEEVLHGKAPFDIFLGHAVSVEVEVNGIPVDTSAYIREINNTAHFKVSESLNQIIFH